jgi:hypothetical protein
LATALLADPAGFHEPAEHLWQSATILSKPTFLSKLNDYLLGIMLKLIRQKM